ncbi:uncharacterized protein ASCRUDRAFT_6105 [Ascoidea rubescens DSM 1968]|uniref:Uncharacterized protein n=1 Tax=Ascoidea rubescens DSM 1968 TaxID=1344418 RepID=A0A1D2VRR3_9ASCO|nr:hypothetical protein ASCRUDRAFT_6105 [Ascoidea rubescens DSM 1968]ODV64255.1 hypothetical protein ASCRUDRAFT_6105 [Ascoidea rubescens DSM 1968]
MPLRQVFATKPVESTPVTEPEKTTPEPVADDASEIPADPAAPTELERSATMVYAEKYRLVGPVIKAANPYFNPPFQFVKTHTGTVGKRLIDSVDSFGVTALKSLETHIPFGSKPKTEPETEIPVVDETEPAVDSQTVNKN